MSDAVSPSPAVAAPDLSVPETMPAVAGRRLRLWPAVVIIVIQWLIIIIPSWVWPGSFEQFYGAILGPIIGFVAIAAWWLFASRIRWIDRGIGLVIFVCSAAAAGFLAHLSIRGMGLIMVGLPWATTAWVGWLLATLWLRWPVRRIGMLVAICLAWVYCGLIRLDGVDGSFSPEINWRWRHTAEQAFLDERADQPAKGESASVASSKPLKLQPGDWPGFRGPNRDGHLVGVRIATDWKEHPPRPLWRHRVGPGWGSFCVVRNHAYTQEQRDKEETVVCYDADNGTELWVHGDPVRFTETVSGAGPRATPTFHDGKLYTLGARGLLNCLDAASGKTIWSREVTEDAGATVPIWAYASSPLVVQGIVTVFGGSDGKAVLGYKASSGEPAWAAGEGKLSYCSTQLAHLGKVDQLLLATDVGVTSFEPASGRVLWKHDWPTTQDQIVRIIQPTVLGTDDVLVGTGMGVGTRRIHVEQAGSTWTDKEVWTSRAIRPYFNDMVAYRDNLYGFDGGMFFVCVDLENGAGRWRARGYGAGQVLLLEDQGLLFILGEKGDVALVEANPERHVQIARFKALEGKTWNHPVIAHGKLFVRNGEEAACYQLTEETVRVAAGK